jgi:hypothetical protein
MAGRILSRHFAFCGAASSSSSTSTSVVRQAGKIVSTVLSGAVPRRSPQRLLPD